MEDAPRTDLLQLISPQMPAENERTRVRVADLIAQVRAEWIPLTQSFAYFAVTPIGPEEVKQFLQDPINAVPTEFIKVLPAVHVLLAPYLERGNRKIGDYVVFQQPAEARDLIWSQEPEDSGVTFAFAIKDVDLAEYHYWFYNALASLAATMRSPALSEFSKLVESELKAEVHGEVDERSWNLKQEIVRSAKPIAKGSKRFNEYVRQAFQDTLTLFLHGICCDIDVDTGPRQMSSRHLRKRLELLQSHFPPPKGYNVLPDQAKRR
jgi:hypothetical protein